jgi:hypothetical protein
VTGRAVIECREIVPSASPVAGPPVLVPVEERHNLMLGLFVQIIKLGRRA